MLSCRSQRPSRTRTCVLRRVRCAILRTVGSVCDPALGPSPPGRLERKTDEPPGRIRGIRGERGRAHPHARRLRRDHRPRRPRARLLAPPHARPRQPARQADLGVRARSPRRPRDRRGRHRGRSRALAVRARARPRLHHHRPPAVPVVHPDRADQGRDRLRPRRLGERGLRRLLARGGRSGLRRERGAGLARRRVRAPGRRGRRVRAGRHARQPLGAGRGARARALHAAHGRHGCPRPLEGRVQRRGALLDRVRRTRDGRRRRAGRPRRRRDAARRRRARRARGARGIRVRRRRHRRLDQLRHRRRRRLDRRPQGGVRLLAARRRRLRARRDALAAGAAPLRRAWSTPTR